MHIFKACTIVIISALWCAPAYCAVDQQQSQFRQTILSQKNLETLKKVMVPSAMLMVLCAGMAGELVVTCGCRTWVSFFLSLGQLYLGATLLKRSSDKEGSYDRFVNKKWSGHGHLLCSVLGGLWAYNLVRAGRIHVHEGRKLFGYGMSLAGISYAILAVTNFVYAIQKIDQEPDGEEEVEQGPVIQSEPTYSSIKR